MWALGGGNIGSGGSTKPRRGLHDEGYWTLLTGLRPVGGSLLFPARTWKVGRRVSGRPIVSHRGRAN